jgi:hypothetical protein
MAINGTYQIEIETPMGSQETQLTFKVTGATLNGSSESSFGQSEFTGTVNGDKVAWNSEINGPMGKMRLSFKGKIKGDDFTGEVEAGMFGTYPFKGKRI